MGQLFVGYYLSRKELFRGNCPGAKPQEKIVWGGQLFRGELLIVQGGGGLHWGQLSRGSFPVGNYSKKNVQGRIALGRFHRGEAIFCGVIV